MKIKQARRLLLIGLGLLQGSLIAQAQTADTRSPYSRYGYGVPQLGATSGSRAMGGLAVGLRDGLITNPTNPASYTSVDSMTFIFDFGLSARYGYLKEGQLSDTRLLGNIDYMTIIYPLSKRMAMSAGLMPLSTTGYTFGTKAAMGGDGGSTTFTRTYSGTGSYNNLYVGLAANPLGGLHLGLNAAYVFGATTRQRQVVYASTGALNAVYSDDLRLRGVKLDFGAQYVLPLDTVSGRTLTVGATFTPGYSYKSERIITQQTVSTQGSSETIRQDVSRDGAYTTPMQLGLGASYRLKDHWMLGAELRYGQWRDAEFTDLEASFQNQYRVILGGEWTPNYRSRRLWSRAKYRAGLSWGNSYLKVPIGSTGTLGGYQELGASLGVAIPLVDRRSALNLSLDYKHLRPKASQMVREHYLGLTVGIIFNESWFRKARVN